MPIGSDPNDTCEIVLKADADKTPRPTFYTYFLSERDFKKGLKLYEESIKAIVDDKIDEHEAKRDAVFDLCLAGWKDVTYRSRPVVFGTDKPADFLTSQELRELAEECLAKPQITERDRRNFVSPPASDGGASAVDAPAANATTPPAQPSPSA